MSSSLVILDFGSVGSESLVSLSPPEDDVEEEEEEAEEEEEEEKA